MVLWRLLCVIIVCALDPALDCLYTFYQPTRVLLNKTPTRLREHNCLAKDGPLHSYGGCDGVVVSFLYSGVICVGVSVVYTRGCIGFCNVCLFSLRSVDYFT